MSKFTYLIAAIWLSAASAEAIVLRHDVPIEKYVARHTLPALVDMRHQGHGVLIDPQWVVTAAHIVFYDYQDKTIMIGDVEREIAYVIFHPGYSKPTDGLFTGDSGPSQAYLRANHDIALIKLKDPIQDLVPMELYRASDENGQRITLFGAGNTGSGITGQQADTRGTLRRAENTLIESNGQWLTYQFDQGQRALPLEGFQGDGDSGGPAIIHQDGVARLAGLVSWDVYDGDITEFKGGIYGMKGSLVRISYYKDWIEDVMTWPVSKLEARHNEISD